MMKTIALLTLALAIAVTVDTTSAAAHAKTLAKIEASDINLSVEGTYAYTKNSSFFDITMTLGTAATGKVDVQAKVTLKTPSCKSAEAELKLDGSVAVALPSAFTTPLNTLTATVSGVPSISSASVAFTKSVGTGEKLEYSVPISTHPMMKLSGTGVDLVVDLTKAGIMEKGLKLPLSVTVKALDTAKVDLTAQCGGESKVCSVGTTDCVKGGAYVTMCSALKTAFPKPLIDINIDVWEVLNKVKKSDMFVPCGDAMCLAIGDVSGNCGGDSLDSGATGNGAVHMAVVALFTVVAAAVFQE